MLVLEATSRRQGERDGDYHWCIDGELAYQQGISCSRPDCGCERGWAGFDSHRATTTVQVVDRPDLTVAELAAQLARSLFDQGWIATPDPADRMVVEFVDEIIMFANHFGESSVLERDGEWIRKRDGNTERPVNPLDRVTLERLTERIADVSPMDALSIASATMFEASNFLEPLVEGLRSAAWPEAQLLGHLLEWLWDTDQPTGWTQLPAWVEQLDNLTVTAARRRQLEGGPQYLIELVAGEEVLGTVCALVNQDGAIENTWFTNEDLSFHQKMLKAFERGYDNPPFRRIATSTARSALHAASTISLAPKPPTWASRPQNQALFDRVLTSSTWIR